MGFHVAHFLGVKLRTPGCFVEKRIPFQRFSQNSMKTIRNRMPVLSLYRTFIETLTDPKTGAVAFFGNLCQESGRKRRIMTCKMRKQGRKMTGQRKGKRKDKDGIFF